MDHKHIYKDIKIQRRFKICNVCGCKIKHPDNFSRHLKTRRHNEVDYIDNNLFILKLQE